MGAYLCVWRVALYLVAQIGANVRANSIPYAAKLNFRLTVRKTATTLSKQNEATARMSVGAYSLCE